MKFALFLGCNIPARVQQYELSAKAVLSHLDVQTVDIREFNCCGYPARNVDFKTFLLLSARNLALSENQGLDIMALCKCCFGSLKKADYVLKENSVLRNEINAILAKEGLFYTERVEIKHFLTVLHHDVGLPKLKEGLTKSFKDLKIAAHYGCHALRPSEVTRFDDPVAPVVFDHLVEVTGAKSIEWTLKLDCCGAPLLGTNDDLAMSLTEKKLADGKKSGADFICTACPWCQLQFDWIQKAMTEGGKSNHLLPSILFPQLLGLSMGMHPENLGLEMNQIDLSKIESFLSLE